MVVYYNRIFCVSWQEIMPNVNTRNLNTAVFLNSTVIVSLGPDITLLASYPTSENNGMSIFRIHLDGNKKACQVTLIRLYSHEKSITYALLFNTQRIQTQL